LVWRLIFGVPYPVTESAKLLLLAEKVVDNPVVMLGMDIWQGDILGIVNDLPSALKDPIVSALLAAYGAPAELPGWLTLYGKAAVEAVFLINILIYPHNGQLVFDAK